jgi:hypothetical protein
MPAGSSAGDDLAAPAVDWLLASDEPAIRALAGRDLLGAGSLPDRDAVVAGSKVAALLHPPSPFRLSESHPYRKFGGAHWRLVSLVELEAPADHPAVARAVDPAIEQVLAWLTGPGHQRAIRTVDGLTRRCASQEGNALAAACRLGRAGDPRVTQLAESLVEWQWPDGGWNCDVRAKGRRSSFHESLPPMWGLHEYAVATGEPRAAEAARSTAELFLDHRLFRASTSGEVIHRSFVALHYPPFWHYDILQALLVLSRIGMAGDERAGDALDVVEHRRLADGRWRSGGGWWTPPGAGKPNAEVVDWGRGGPNEMITLNALRVLVAAGRIEIQAR